MKSGETNEEGINEKGIIDKEVGHVAHDNEKQKLRRSTREKITNSQLRDYVCG